MDDAQAVIERLHSAMGNFVKGDPGSALELFSQQEDVTLGNPFGPFVRGWERVLETAAAAATLTGTARSPASNESQPMRLKTSRASSRSSGIGPRSAVARS